MRKRFVIVLIFFLFSLTISPLSQHTFAQTTQDWCQFVRTEPLAIIPPELSYLSNKTEFTYTIHINNVESGQYKASLRWGGPGEIAFYPLTPGSDGNIQFRVTPSTIQIYQEGTHQIKVERIGATGAPCITQYTISKLTTPQTISCNIYVSPQTPNPQTPVKYSGTIEPDGLYRIRFPSINKNFPEFSPDANHNISEQNLGLIDQGNYPVVLQTSVPEFFPNPDGGGFYQNVWKDVPSTNCNISNLIVLPTSLNPTPNSSAVPVGSGAPGTTPAPTACIGANCTKAGGDPCGNPSNPGFKTAIGCIHTNPIEFTKDFLKFIVGIGGGLAFLMMLLGAFQMLTSAGNPETLQAGRERLTSAIIGLLFVIFAVLLMQIIGFDILGLPGFGRS